MAPAESRLEWTSAYPGRSRTELGSEHPGVGDVPRCSEAAERGCRLDDESWKRFHVPARGCDECGPTDAPIGRTVRTFVLNSAAAGDQYDECRPTRRANCACKS